jgi:hypothetical protein
MKLPEEIDFSPTKEKNFVGKRQTFVKNIIRRRKNPLNYSSSNLGSISPIFYRQLLYQ